MSGDLTTLIQRARAGDQSAFSGVVSVYRERVFRLAVRYLRDPEAARDASQEVFLKLWQRFSDYDISKEFDPWFFRLARNIFVDHYRIAKRRLESPENVFVPPSVPPRATHWSLDLEKLFDEASTFLSERQREAFLLTLVEGFSSEEAGDIMGVTSSTVRNLVLQAREKLKGYFK